MHNESQRIKLKTSVTLVSSDDEQYFVRVLALDLIHLNYKMYGQLNNNQRQVEFVVAMSGYWKLNNISSPQKYFLNINKINNYNDKSKQQRKKEIYRKQIKDMNNSYISCDLEAINIQNHNSNEDIEVKKIIIVLVVRVSNKLQEIETKIKLFNLSISNSTQNEYNISIQQSGQQSYKSYLIIERLFPSQTYSTLRQNVIKSFGTLQIQTEKRRKSAYLSKLQIKMVQNQILVEIVHRNYIELPNIVSGYYVIPNKYIITDNYASFIISRIPLELNPYKNISQSEQQDSQFSSSSSEQNNTQYEGQLATKFIITYKYNQNQMLFIKERGLNYLQKITNISRNQIALTTRSSEQAPNQIHLLNRKKLQTIHIFAAGNINLCIAGTNQYQVYVLSGKNVAIIGLEGNLCISNVIVYHHDIKNCIMKLQNRKLLIGNQDQISIIQKSPIDAIQAHQSMAQTQIYQIYSAM